MTTRFDTLGEVKQFAFGEVVVPRGVTRFFVVLEGRCRVVRPGDPPLEGQDRLGVFGETTLRHLDPGATFGNDPADRETEVRAETPVAALFFGPARSAPTPTTAPSAVASAELAPTREHPFATRDGHFRSRPAPRGAFPFIPQFDATDCAVACLAMVAEHLGLRVSASRIRTLAGTDVRGTSLAAVTRTARTLGLAARSAKVSAEHVERLPLPAIIHWERRHWVVLVEVTPTRARIADPAVGLEWVSREALGAAWDGHAALFDFAGRTKGDASDALAIWSLVPELSRFAPILLRSFFLALVAAGLTMLLPVITQVVIDRVVVDEGHDLLAWVAGFMAALFVCMTAARVLNGYLMAFVAVRIDAAVLDALVERLLALPLPYFLARRTGDIQRRLAGAREVRETLVKIAVFGLISVVQFATAAALMAVYSPQLTLTFFALAPIYGLMTFLSQRYVVPIVRRLEEERGRYQSDQLDAIKGIETLKVAAAEGQMREGLLDRFLGTARQQFAADYARFAYDGLLHGAGGMTQVLFLWVAAHLAIDGALTVGGFVAFSFLVMLANEPLFQILSLLDELKRSEVLVRRLADVFEAAPEQGGPEERRKLIPVRHLEGAVALRGLSFAYPGALDRPVLTGIDLEVRPGERVAIVGRSGSGKSTLVKLLAGLLEPTSGTLLFDGHDHRTLDHRQLRRHIGVVLQDLHVFSGSILENIALGEELDLERAIRAARTADAHDFIRDLPGHYHAQIGESGLRLSGGQLQRLAIARALYKTPAIFIFDEATSALDTDSERTIQENLATSFGGATVFIIAHRLSTVRDADRIIVLEQGEIVEQGTHTQLHARGGLYFELVRRQEAA